MREKSRRRRSIDQEINGINGSPLLHHVFVLLLLHRRWLQGCEVARHTIYNTQRYILLLLSLCTPHSPPTHPHCKCVCVCHAPLFSFRTGFCVILFWTVMAADATPGIVNLGLDVHNENYYRGGGTGKRTYIIYYYKL